jgi:hypothetical protein
VERGEEVKCYCLQGDSFSSPIGDADSGYFPLDHSSTNIADADTPSLSVHDVDGLRVRNSRHSSHPSHFVFGKFVLKPNCS